MTFNLIPADMPEPEPCTVIASIHPDNSLDVNEVMSYGIRIVRKTFTSVGEVGTELQTWGDLRLYCEVTGREILFPMYVSSGLTFHAINQSALVREMFKLRENTMVIVTDYKNTLINDELFIEDGSMTTFHAKYTSLQLVRNGVILHTFCKGRTLDGEAN